MFFLLATLGFASFAFYDFFQINKKRVLTTLFSIFGCMGVLASIILLVFLNIPLANKVNPIFLAIQLIISGFFFVLLIYSTFFAFKSTKGVVSSGMYGVVRHPGFYWFTLMLVSLIPIFRSSKFLLSALFLIVMNSLLILLEDTVLFPRIFPEYNTYKSKVPFLVPKLFKSNEK